ncbi:NAD(P)-dependent oxidoreductase [Ruminococcus sp. OM05-10BH]|nr:NAD(P)-dependent oxidoreductase [Ruminococcus sp. OM05-10BH]
MERGCRTCRMPAGKRGRGGLPCHGRDRDQDQMSRERYPRFPLFLSLCGREILIVGAGNIAVRRAGILLPFGCSIRMCAPEREDELKDPLRGWILDGKVRYESRRFEKDVLTGREFLVFAATDENETNAEIVQICRGKGILVNNASDASMCDFFFPSVLRDEEIVIGIAGDGSDHRKVKQIRKKIQDMLKGEKRPK